jgi:hypothetical protein
MNSLINKKNILLSLSTVFLVLLKYTFSITHKKSRLMFVNGEVFIVHFQPDWKPRKAGHHCLAVLASRSPTRAVACARAFVYATQVVTRDSSKPWQKNETTNSLLQTF